MDGSGPETLRLDGLPAPWRELPWRPLAERRNANKAAVFWCDHEGGRVVAKVLVGGAPVRFARFRRWALRHEADVLAALGGVAGVPRLRARGAAGFVMSHVPGASLRDMPRRDVTPPILDEIERVVDAIHARGYAICDLHRRNVLVAGTTGGDGHAPSVHLIDFELALDRRRLVGRLVGSVGLRMDLWAVARLRERYGAPLSAEHEQRLQRGPSWIHRTWHGVRRRTKRGRARSRPKGP